MEILSFIYNHELVWNALKNLQVFVPAMTVAVYHLVRKTGRLKVAVNGTHQNPEWKFPWNVCVHLHGHIHSDEPRTWN